MHKRILFFSIVLLVGSCLFGCGADDLKDYNTSIEGTWDGQMYQDGGARCSDGTVVDSDTETPTRTVTLEVTGGINQKDDVKVNFGECVYTGSRPSEEEVLVNTSSSECVGSLTLTVIDSQTMRLEIPPTAIEKSDNSLCSIREKGLLYKQE